MPEVTRRVISKTECRSFICSTGTWAAVTNTGAPYQGKTAANSTSLVLIPIMPPPVMAGQFGAMLQYVDVPIRVATQNLDSTPTAILYRRQMIAVVGAGTNMTASSVSITSTGLTLTAASTDRLTHHVVASPVWDYSSSGPYDYNLLLTINGATSSAIRVYDALAYWDILT